VIFVVWPLSFTNLRERWAVGDDCGGRPAYDLCAAQEMSESQILNANPCSLKTWATLPNALSQWPFFSGRALAQSLNSYF